MLHLIFPFGLVVIWPMQLATPHSVQARVGSLQAQGNHACHLGIQLGSGGRYRYQFIDNSDTSVIFDSINTSMLYCCKTIRYRIISRALKMWCSVLTRAMISASEVRFGLASYPGQAWVGPGWEARFQG